MSGSLPVAEPSWHVAWTILLPRPQGVDRGCIRAAPPWRERLARQAVPRRAARDCCYYHGIDWQRVSTAAIQLLRQAQREGLAGKALDSRLAALARARELPAEEKRALGELLSADFAIRPPRFFSRDRGYRYGNGRHRTTAMLDSGVRRTVIVRLHWHYPETT